MKCNDAVYTLKRSKIREFTQLAKQTIGCVALTLGEPDFDTPSEIEQEVQQAFNTKQTHYIANNGMPELCERIAQFEHEQNGMDYTKDEIIVTAGATEALFVALYGIINPTDEVIVPIPAFSLYEEIIKMSRGICVPMNTSQDAFQITEENLRSKLTDHTKAIILNSPNNPTGCVLNQQSLQAIYNVAKETGIFVICDDVYRQLCYTDNYHSFTEYRDLKKQIILVQSFSKPYAMTGWRMGYLAMDASIKERLELVHQFTIVSTPAPFQLACIKALDYDITPFLNTYRSRRTYVLQRLHEMNLAVTQPDGAFYVFPSIQEFHMTSEEFAKRMIQEEKLAVTPGIAFGLEGYIRLTYCYSDTELKEGLDRLETFIQKLRKQ